MYLLLFFVLVGAGVALAARGRARGRANLQAAMLLVGALIAAGAVAMLSIPARRLQPIIASWGCWSASGRCSTAAGCSIQGRA